ncbi:carbonic anhydrase [bacterium]|nr:carbonic anhydrase [bacterium]
MTLIAAALVASLTLAPAAPAAADGDPLTRLLAGNQRYGAAQPLHPNQSPERRRAVAAAQAPFAAVVGCADSRVPPELVLDAGLGDLFVVRTAGNVVDEIGLGSIEFAVAVLGTPLVVVLGHERCGAVEATLRGGPVPGDVQAVVDAIRPNLARAAARPGDPLANAVHDNVAAVVARLRSAEPVLAPRVRDGTLRIVGAVYDLDSGAVTLVDAPGGR